MEKLARINPLFYPQPVIDNRTGDPVVVSIMKKRTDGFLAQDDFAVAYDEACSFIHTMNPYRDPILAKGFRQRIASWDDKIIKLLNSHTMHPIGDEQFMYLIHMKGVSDGQLHSYVFRRITVAEQ